MTQKKNPNHPAQKIPSYLKKDQHWVLVNKQTGKASSSNNWLNVLAAISVKNQDCSGIATLLPQAKAQKLLQKNILVKKKRRGLNNSLDAAQSRAQTKLMLPMLAVIYGQKLPSHKPPRRNDFCKWAVTTLKDENSRAKKYAINQGYDELLNAERSVRWWLDQLNKMQS